MADSVSCSALAGWGDQLENDTKTGREVDHNRSTVIGPLGIY